MLPCGHIICYAGDMPAGEHVLTDEERELLSAAALRYWELEKRIRQDKKVGGVTMRMSRTYMDLNIMSLIADGVIGLEDLEGFSEDLREKMAFIMRDR